jgi:hypothetical protein
MAPADYSAWGRRLERELRCTIVRRRFIPLSHDPEKPDHGMVEDVRMLHHLFVFFNYGKLDRKRRLSLSRLHRAYFNFRSLGRFWRFCVLSYG